MNVRRAQQALDLAEELAAQPPMVESDALGAKRLRECRYCAGGTHYTPGPEDPPDVHNLGCLWVRAVALVAAVRKEESDGFVFIG